MSESSAVAMPTAEDFFKTYTGPMDGEGELSPMVFYNSPEGAHVCVLADTPAPEDGGIQRMIRYLIGGLKRDVGPATWIWFGSEGYAKSFPKDEDRPLEPGELQRTHATDPEVREVIVLTGVSAELTIMASRSFKREGGEVVWLDELTSSEFGDITQVGGGVPAALREGLS